MAAGESGAVAVGKAKGGLRGTSFDRTRAPTVVDIAWIPEGSCDSVQGESTFG